jgi:hypothetical protein
MQVQIIFATEVPLHALLEYIKAVDDVYYKYLCLDRITANISDNILEFDIIRKDNYLTYFKDEAKLGYFGPIYESHFEKSLQTRYNEIEYLVEIKKEKTEREVTKMFIRSLFLI